MVSNIRLFVKYATRTVEKKTEFYIYDFIVLAGSLGGTLGLLLGYSCLSIAETAIDSIERVILDWVLFLTRDDRAIDGTIETVESAVEVTPEQATPLTPSQSPTPEQRDSVATPLTPSQANDAPRPEWPPQHWTF